MEAPRMDGLEPLLIVMLILALFGIWKLVSMAIWLVTHLQIS